MHYQYSLSAETKRYVKYSIYMQLMVSMIVIVQLVFYFGNQFLSDSFEFPEVPKPHVWEYIWLTSLVPALAGYLSINKNRLSLLKFYLYGTIILGLTPILITMVFNASDFYDYAQTKQSTNLFHDFPVIVLWYMFLFVVVQIHAFGIYFSRILLKAWSKKRH